MSRSGARGSGWRAVVLVAGFIALPVLATADGDSGAADTGDAAAEPAATTAPGANPDAPCWEESPPCSAEAEAETASPQPIVILRSSGRGRPQPAEIAAWATLCHRQLTPFQTALDRLLAAREVERPPELVPYCRRLARELLDLDRESLFPAPDLAADLHLKHGLDLFAEAAVACVHQRWAATDYYLAEADHAMHYLDLVLRRYQQAP